MSRRPRQPTLPAMSRCGRNPTPSQALCSVCCRLFGGVTGFDKHREKRPGYCSDPATLGMVEMNGIWRRQEVDPTRLEELRRAHPPSSVAAVAEKTAGG